jgi:N-acetylmuramoyl-L-alanine amidase CwlA
MCVNADGNWSITYKNSIQLTASLLKKHNLSVNNLYRHYDITGKDCPRMMIREMAWDKFKEDVESILNTLFGLKFK